MPALPATDAPARYREYAHAAAAELAVAGGLPDAPQWLDRAGPAAVENDWAAACLARACGERATAAQLWEGIGAGFERDHS